VAGLGAVAAAAGFVWLALTGIEHAVHPAASAHAEERREAGLGEIPRESSPSMHLE
jgi:hypothetical protein